MQSIRIPRDPLHLRKFLALDRVNPIWPDWPARAHHGNSIKANMAVAHADFEHAQSKRIKTQTYLQHALHLMGLAFLTFQALCSTLVLRKDACRGQVRVLPVRCVSCEAIVVQ